MTVDWDIKSNKAIAVKVEKVLSNSYTMGCPPVRGDNPQAIASGLSYIQVDKHGITILYHLHVSGNRCESDCRSRGREFDPGLVPYFCGE